MGGILIQSSSQKCSRKKETMLIRKAFKYRLKTNQTEAVILSRYAGCCRFVWNKALALQRDLLATEKRRLSYAKLAAMLPVWKIEHPFLKEAPSQSLQQTLMNLDVAIKDAFDKASPKKLPQFKKKGIHDAFQVPQGFEVNGQAVKLPKLGWVKYRNCRRISGTAKNLTFSKVAGNWYVSIQTEEDVAIEYHESSFEIGVDVGVVEFAALSDGTFVKSNHAFRRSEAKLAILQQKLSQKQKFSKNWQKIKGKINRLHVHVANQRRDHQHKASHEISKNHAMIVMEDLNVKGMTASAKGTVETPGKGVNRKAALNKSILDQGWSEFRRQIGYKTLWRGGLYILVPAAYTSQECSVCHHIDVASRVSQSQFRCTSCGHTENADTNASKNIKAAGLRRVSLWQPVAAGTYLKVALAA